MNVLHLCIALRWMFGEIQRVKNGTICSLIPGLQRCPLQLTVLLLFATRQLRLEPMIIFN